MKPNSQLPGTGFVNRLAAYFITLFLAVTLNFFLPRAMPGDPLALVAGNSVRQMGEEHITELRESMGLDQPLGEQYLRYLGQLAQGNLGQSYRFSGGRSVAEVLGERFLWTFSLVFISLGVATLIGAPLGAWAISLVGDRVLTVDGESGDDARDAAIESEAESDLAS